MRKLIEPQILFVYNQEGKIKKVIFLTYDEEEYKSTTIYQLYKFLRQRNSEMFIPSIEETMMKEHILLTLNLSELRGYIQERILHTDLQICVFSLWENIDYINNDGSVFTPFSNLHLSNKTSDTTILYEVYKGAATNTIFCVLDEENTSKKYLCSDGIYNEKIYPFVKQVLDRELEETLILELFNKNLHKSVFDINWFEDVVYYIKQIKFVDKIFNEFYFNNIYLSGSKLILLNDSDFSQLEKETSYIDVYVYDKDFENNSIFIIQDKLLQIINIKKYDEIITTNPQIENIIIKQKNIKQNIRVDFNASINSIIEIDFEIDFFIEPTKKTKNIFLDRTKKINIMTSSTHIFFSSYQNQYDLYRYLTKLIVGLQVSKNQIEFNKQEIKLGSRYYSRYCQGIRKPSFLNSLEDVDLNNYKNFNDVFYKRISNIIVDKESDGDVFNIDGKGKYVICKQPHLKNIGFINEFYQGYNVCLPCCYKKTKDNTEIHKNCISKGLEDEIQETLLTKETIRKIILEPYLHIFKQYRVIMDPNKIGLLLGKTSEMFNADIKILYRKAKRNLKEISLKEILTSDLPLSVLADTVKKVKNYKNHKIDNKKILNVLVSLYTKYNVKKSHNMNLFINTSYSFYEADDDLDKEYIGKYLLPESNTISSVHSLSSTPTIGHSYLLGQSLSYDKYVKQQNQKQIGQIFSLDDLCNDFHDDIKVNNLDDFHGGDKNTSTETLYDSDSDYKTQLKLNTKKVLVSKDKTTFNNSKSTTSSKTRKEQERQSIKEDTENPFFTNENFYKLLKRERNSQKKRLFFEENIYSYLGRLNQYLLVNKHNRIELAKNYIIYMVNDEIVDLKNIYDIKHLNMSGVFVYNDSIYYDPKVLEEYKVLGQEYIKTLQFFLIIQNKIHVLKAVNKETFDSPLYVDELPLYIKEKICNEIFNVQPFKFSKNVNGVSFDYNSFSIDGEIIHPDNKETKYLYKIDKINLNPGTIGYYIVNVLYKKYFDHLYENNDKKNLFKKTFLVNLNNYTTPNINFNIIFSFKKYKKNILERIVEPYLNPKFIDERELRRLKEI